MPGVFVLANPTSGGGKGATTVAAVESALAGRGVACRVGLTSGPGNGADLARDAVRHGHFDALLVIGGDGTLSEAVHGALSALDAADAPASAAAATPLPSFVYVPAGTGSDFSRLGCCCHDAEQAATAAAAAYHHRGGTAPASQGVSWRDIDVGRIDFQPAIANSTHAAPASASSAQTQVRYFVNVASFGLGSGVVTLVERLKQSPLRHLGGKAVFLAAGALNLLSLRQIPFSIRRIDSPCDTTLPRAAGAADSGAHVAVALTTMESESALRETGAVGAPWATHGSTVAFCNGRYFGGGMCIAPRSQLDDGQLSLTVWRAGLVGFVCGVVGIYTGRAASWPTSSTATGAAFEVTSAEANVRFEVDGELSGCLPATVSTVPGRLRMAVGEPPRGGNGTARRVALLTLFGVALFVLWAAVFS